MPDGTRRKTNSPFSCTTRCPALLPPWYRTTKSAFIESSSTILPLPSSPHCAPMTATTAIVEYPFSCYPVQCAYTISLFFVLCRRRRHTTKEKEFCEDTSRSGRGSAPAPREKLRRLRGLPTPGRAPVPREKLTRVLRGHLALRQGLCPC